MERSNADVKTLKELIRILSKVVGGIAWPIFVRAPFTDTGWMLMGRSVIVGLICFAAYLWSEPDVELPSSDDSI
jgi:hypothetical protein